MRVLVISDTQFPFSHPDTFDFLISVQKEYKTDTVVHIGDEMDFHALSNYDSDPDGYSPGHELERGLKSMHKLYRLFPEVSVCISNHTSRPFRKAYKHGIPKAFLKSYSEFLQAPPLWKWGDFFEIDGVMYEHGEACGGQYAHIKNAIINQKPTVIGHHHSNAGIIYTANREKTIFGLAVGCLLDETRYAFRYGKKFARKPVLGCGVVLEGNPIFVQLHTNKRGGWKGRIVV